MGLEENVMVEPGEGPRVDRVLDELHRAVAEGHVDPAGVQAGGHPLEGILEVRGDAGRARGEDVRRVVGREHRVEPVIPVPGTVGVEIGRTAVLRRQRDRVLAEEERVARPVGNLGDLRRTIVHDDAVVLVELGGVLGLVSARKGPLASGVAGELLHPGVRRDDGRVVVGLEARIRRARAMSCGCQGSLGHCSDLIWIPAIVMFGGS